LKFWLLTTEYPPFHGGGISTYCYHTASMLANLNVEVTVFIPDDSVLDYKIENSPEGARIVRFHSNRSKLHDCLGYFARVSYEFALIVQHLISIEGKPDVIETQDYHGIAYYLLQFKHLLYEQLKDIPIVITMHSPAFIYLEYNRVPVYRFPEFHVCQTEKEALLMADLIICPTGFLLDATEPYVTLANKKKVVLRNPYYTKETQGPGPVTRNKIAFFGKLSMQKGSFELMKYFQKMWDDGFPHPLNVFGGTDIVFHPEHLTMGQLIEDKYKKYIDEKLLLFHGKIKPTEIANELSSAHVIIVPSIIDNLPYVIIETMALGKIVLASVQGGQREMIDHGLNGFLFDHTIENDFEEKLKLVLSLSDEKIIEIGKAAQKKVADMYAPEKIAKQKLQLLNDAIRETKQTRSFPFLYQNEFKTVTVSGDLLSVIIPYYNMGKYIKDTVQSIKASNYQPIEIMIINDGSTEPECIAVLNEMAQIDGVKVFNKRNSGLAETRNYGALRATGDLIAFLDSDNMVAPDYYEKAIKILKQYDNVFFVGGFIQNFQGNNGKYVTYNPQPPYLMVHNPAKTTGLIYKKAAFLEAGLNDKTVDYGMEGYEHIVHLLSKGYNGVMLPEFLFLCRVRPDSMIRDMNREKWLYAYKYIAEKHSHYYAKFASQITNLLNANGPGFLFDNPTFGHTVVINPQSSSWVARYTIGIIKKNKTLKRIALRLKKHFN
jgi:glycosyltransferase involved in cell wall biosynthesis